MKTIRQGDLLFIPQAEVSDHVLEYAKAPESTRKNGVIAEGEATGHHHRVEVLDNAIVFQAYNDVYVKVGPNGVSIVHEEHGPVKLDPDTTYKVNRAREFDYLAVNTRFVAD
jgi:hypothetical protein